jgi:hypothetical protein
MSSKCFFFHWGLPFYPFIISYKIATCPGHFILFDLIIVIIFREQYWGWSWNSSLYAIFCILRLNSLFPQHFVCVSTISTIRLQLWRRRHHVSVKRWHLPMSLRGSKPQIIIIIVSVEWKSQTGL